MIFASSKHKGLIVAHRVELIRNGTGDGAKKENNLSVIMEQRACHNGTKGAAERTGFVF